MNYKENYNKSFWYLVGIVGFIALAILTSTIWNGIMECFNNPYLKIQSTNFPINITKYSQNQTYRNQTILTVCANGKTEKQAHFYIQSAEGLSAIMIIFCLGAIIFKSRKGDDDGLHKRGVAEDNRRKAEGISTTAETEKANAAKESEQI